VEAGKVESVVMEGLAVRGKLKAPEPNGDERVEAFRTVRPEGDEALLPLLRDKGVGIRVQADEPAFAVQLLLTLLPWVLIIGVWVWFSRRAQNMMAKGGPFGNI